MPVELVIFRFVDIHLIPQNHEENRPKHEPDPIDRNKEKEHRAENDVLNNEGLTLFEGEGAECLKYEYHLLWCLVYGHLCPNNAYISDQSIHI